MKVWVWVDHEDYKVSPTKPKFLVNWYRCTSYLYSANAIRVCLKSGKSFFGPMRVSDKVKKFNLTAKEVK